MVLNRSVIVGMGLAAGAATAVALYATAAASPAPAPVKQVNSRLASDVQPTTPAPTVVYSPCAAPAELEDGVCVTHKVVTKVAPATAAKPTHAQEQATSGDSRSTRPSRTSSTPAATHREDRATDDTDHEDADHEDADHGDEPGDDHGTDDGGDHGDD